jgi:hypothetical protein
MRRRNMLYFIVGCGLFTVTLLALFGGAQRTLAEPTLQEPGTPTAPALTPPPNGPSANSPDQVERAPVRSAPEAIDAPQAGTSYVHVSGSVFVPLYSSTAFSYGGSGCIYFAPSSSYFLQAPLELPYGSTITQLRLYYKDANAGANGTLYLAQYDDGLGYTYVVTAPTTTQSGTGWGTTTVNTNIVPDYVNYSYTLLWVSPVADSTLQLCGFRIAYTPPPVFGVALPLIRK